MKNIKAIVADFHFKAMFWMTIYGVSAGLFLTSKNSVLIFLGVICLMLDLAYEYYFLKKMDTREDLEKAQKEIKIYVAEAKRAKEEINNAKREIDELKRDASIKVKDIEKIKREINPDNIFRFSR